MGEVVVEALFNGDREAQIQAANELSKLTSKKKQKLAESGVIVPLISMLCYQDYEAIEAALNALLSLACGSERNKIRITKSGAIPELLKLLQCQNVQLLELAMAALFILSSCTANKLAIASSGAIQLLVEFINGGYINDNDDDINNSSNYISLQAKLDAIATLHNLSTCHHIIPSMVSSGIISPLLQAIYCSEKSSDLVEKAMGLLEKFVSSSEIALQETATNGGAIQALVEIMEESSPQCKEHAVTVLFLICRSCRDKYRGLILREGAMPGLLQLSVDGTGRAKDVARDLLLLLRDCSNHRGVRSKKQLQNELIMEQIMEEIDGNGGERMVGKALRMVEEMISNLRA